MFRKTIHLLIFLSCLPAFSRAQKPYHEMVADYIAQYQDLAVAEQLRSGVPAAITLAQGIYETGAGSSELCTGAANHFGIKCKNNWTGATYAYSDDRKDECFRKYEDAAQSYRDHSDFLKNNPRYSALFQLDPQDYEDWAKGLKKCGYATNPLYAQKIIQTIEDYHLQEFTVLALGRSGYPDNEDEIVAVALDKGVQGPYVSEKKPVSQGQPGASGPADKTDVLFAETKSGTGMTGYYESSSKNGLKGFYARKGDLLLEYAIKHHIRYAKLLEWNDLQDAPVSADMFIYLEPKRKTGLKTTYTVMPGMNLLQISQETGVQLEQLRRLNQLTDGEEPVAGTTLQLQKSSAAKPEIYVQNQAENKPQVLAKARPAKPEYIYISHNEGFAEPDAATPERESPEGNITEEAVSKREDAQTSPARAEQAPAAGEMTDEEDVQEEPEADEIPGPGEPSKQQAEAAVTPAEAEAEMTPLERLKAHMDQVVYGRTHKEMSPAAESSTDSNPAPITTLPARQQEKRTQPVSAASGPADRFYIAKPGDTAFGIARKFGISLDQLREWNKLQASMTIRKGQKLRVAP